MPELLIEFFSEEIPARMQKRGEEDFARLLTEKLKAAGLEPKNLQTFSGPRRLALAIPDLPAATPDVREERKGPRVGAPEGALQGFLKSAGLAKIEDAQIVEDKKGAFYVAMIEKRGADTAALLSEIVPEIVRAFPWPKSMRSRDQDLRWVRPLHNVLVVFGGKHVKVDLPGVKSEPITWGHRFHAPRAIEVANLAQYEGGLRAAHVLIDREARKAAILKDARTVCEQRKLELVEDQGLLEEVAGLSEWPVVLLGDMDPAFLDLPAEVIRLSMRTHQKYFAVRDPKTQKLAPYFVTVANISAKDGGKAIAEGNARVLSARLNDARFFWDLDKAKGIEDEERLKKLDAIVFHQKLGSIGDKVRRIEALAVELAPIVGADVEQVRRAARLCKADLVTEVVGEFPELQGQIGRQLYELAHPSPLVGEGREGGRSASAAASNSDRPLPLTPPHQGEGNSVAIALEDHYRPLGPNDRVPSDPVAIAVALADKLDTLVGFWAIDEKPTGSSDPYGLRRAALGSVRVCLEQSVRLRLHQALSLALNPHRTHLQSVISDDDSAEIISQRLIERNRSLTDSVLAFLADRLKVQLRDQGKRHDLVDAVFALGDDDLVRIVARVEALDTFLKTEDGKNLLAGYRRAANILKAEEKKNPDLSAALQKHEFRIDQLKEAGEKQLFDALERAAPAAASAVAREDFSAAMAALAELRAPVDKFFEAVLVNAPEENLRMNRLLLLSRMRDALHAVADFSKVEG